MIDVGEILKLQKDNVVEWHNQLILLHHEMPFMFIEENNMWNFLLWHEEDIARIKETEPIKIVEVKRNIDNFNQSRNNAIEKIDEWILSYLDAKNIKPAQEIHSETPGMMIDRLSIMALKRYHMFEETLRNDALSQHKAACTEKVSVLDEQIADLAGCLSNVLDLLVNGKLKFKVYRQFKMYNDPTLNPELYKRTKNVV
jgi:Protein of unknown function (DUF4254)